MNLGCTSADNHIPWDDIYDYHPYRESDMGRITLESNELDYHYLPKVCIEFALPLLDFVKVMH